MRKCSKLILYLREKDAVMDLNHIVLTVIEYSTENRMYIEGHVANTINHEIHAKSCIFSKIIKIYISKPMMVTNFFYKFLSNSLNHVFF